MESFFSPETPTEKTSYKVTRKAEQRGPLTFPYFQEEETLSDKEIDDELQLEFKLNRSMQDPLNLSNHGTSKAAHGYGKTTKSFANFAPNETDATYSKQESQLQPISVANDEEDFEDLELVEESDEKDRLNYRAYIHDFYRNRKQDLKEVEADPQHDPETNEMYRKAFAKKIAHYEEMKSKKPKPKRSSAWDKFSAPRDPLQEELGARDKATAYGNPTPTTKQPYASGVPTNHMERNNEEYFDEDEIADELGLQEWIASTPIIAKSGMKSELEFFDTDSPDDLRSEDEFKRNQEKKKLNIKRK